MGKKIFKKIWKNAASLRKNPNRQVLKQSCHLMKTLLILRHQTTYLDHPRKHFWDPNVALVRSSQRSNLKRECFFKIFNSVCIAETSLFSAQGKIKPRKKFKWDRDEKQTSQCGDENPIGHTIGHILWISRMGSTSYRTSHSGGHWSTRQRRQLNGSCESLAKLHWGFRQIITGPQVSTTP